MKTGSKYRKLQYSICKAIRKLVFQLASGFQLHFWGCLYVLNIMLSEFPMSTANRNKRINPKKISFNSQKKSRKAYHIRLLFRYKAIREEDSSLLQCDIVIRRTFQWHCEQPKCQKLHRPSQCHMPEDLNLYRVIQTHL